MTGAELARALRDAATALERMANVNGLTLEPVPGVTVSVVTTGVERVRRHRYRSALQDAVTERRYITPLQNTVTEAPTAEACPPSHSLSILPESVSPGNAESFPESESLLPDSSDLDLTGNVRVQSSVTEPRRAARVRKQNAKPVPFPQPYDPPAELVGTLAKKHEATREQVLRAVHDMDWYWVHGPGAGKKKALQYWHQTFGNRVAQLAQSGALYTERPQSGSNGVIQWPE